MKIILPPPSHPAAVPHTVPTRLLSCCVPFRESQDFSAHRHNRRKVIPLVAGWEVVPSTLICATDLTTAGAIFYGIHIKTLKSVISHMACCAARRVFSNAFNYHKDYADSILHADIMGMLEGLVGAANAVFQTERARLPAYRFRCMAFLANRRASARGRCSADQHPPPPVMDSPIFATTPIY